MDFNSLVKVSQHFAKPETCLEHLTQVRWNGNVSCVFCEHDKCYTLKGANKRFKCAKCRKQFSPIKGTIFENSPIPLNLWFIGIYLITSHKKGISSMQLAKDLGITQKSAWFKLHRIRFVLNSGTFEHKDGALIEMDETYVGGKEKNKHGYYQTVGKPVVSAKPMATKAVVVGMLERGGKVKAKRIPNAKAASLMPVIAENIRTSATIVTDEWMGYHRVTGAGYSHEKVTHKDGRYVRGVFHTNNIEGFWSQLKRGIIGIYHQVSVKHLDNYVGEFEYRYNTRELSEGARFDNMLSLSSKRLTYDELKSKPTA